MQDSWSHEPTRRFTAAEVLHMLEVGVLHEDEPVELLEGELVIVSPQGPSHSNLAVVVRRLFERAYGDAYFVRDHSPVDASPKSLPEPDVAVVRGDINDFWHRLPTGADTVLVVELSVSTARLDRKKAAIYGRAGYRTYWRVDVETRRLEVREGPSADGEYKSTRLYNEDETVTLPECGVSLTVRDILPKV